LRYLKRYRVTLDVGHQVAYFARGETYDKPEERRIGFSMIREGAKTLIIGVQHTYPAETAGLRDGDV